MSAISLRPAGPAEAPVLAALHTAGFDEKWSPGAMKDLLAMPGAFALLLVDGEGPRGFVLARAAGGEAEILSIGVHPGFRGRGYARILLSAALAAAQERGADELFLEVAVDNTPALCLYTALGFAEAGRRRGYYRRPTGPAADALVMKVVLPRKE